MSELNKQHIRVGYLKSVTISEMRKEIDRIEKTVAEEDAIYGEGHSSQNFFGITFYVKPEKKKKTKWKK